MGQRSRVGISRSRGVADTKFITRPSETDYPAHLPAEKLAPLRLVLLDRGTAVSMFGSGTLLLRFRGCIGGVRLGYVTLR